VMKPLARAATLLPPAALRADAGVALTAFARYAPSLLTVRRLGMRNWLRRMLPRFKRRQERSQLCQAAEQDRV